MSPTAIRAPAAPTNEIVDLQWHSDIDLLLQAGRPPIVLGFGPPGVGKSTLMKNKARAYCKNSALVLDGTPETEMTHIWGRYVWKAGEMDFVEGPLPRALRESAAVSDFAGARWLLVEEFAAIPLEVRATFLPIRQEREVTCPITHTVYPVPAYFRLLLTSNYEVLSACRKSPGLAQALFDGLYVFEVPEPGQSDVRRFVQHEFPNAGRKRIDQVLRLWNEYRSLKESNGITKARLSPRSALELCRLLEIGMGERVAVQVALVNKFAAADPDLFSAAKLKNSLGDGSGESSDTDQEQF